MPRDLAFGRLSRAAVFAGAALATSAACGGKAKPADPQVEQRELEEEQRPNRGCVDPDPAEIERLEKRRAEAQTDEDKASIDQELERARMPVCMPYGAPPARRRVV